MCTIAAIFVSGPSDRKTLARSVPWQARGRYGLTREIGWLNREIGPKTVRAHNKSCPAALWDGPACRCSIFFGGNFVAAPDIAQKPAAPPRSHFARYPALRTPAALRRRRRYARRRFRAAHLVVVTVFLHMRPRRDGRELSCREKDSRRRTKFGREGAGTFQCPRPLYIGRNLTYPFLWHLSMPRDGPCKGPTTRTRVPHDRVRYALIGLDRG